MTPPLPGGWSGRWRLRARTRLTLWYTMLLAGTLALLLGATLLTVERELFANLDESLAARALGVDQSVQHELEEGERGRVSELEALASGLDMLRVWDGRGRPIIGIEAGARALPSRAAAPPPADRDVVTTEQLARGTTVRVVTHTLRSGERVVGIVQVGRSTADIESVLGRLRVLSLAGLVISLILAGVGGAFLARRALAPVVRVTHAAELIGAGSLSQRVGLDLPDDELGRLARAFDAMIERLEDAFERQRRFTADAAHELRTPLAVIRSQIDVALARSRTPEQYVAVLAAVRTESDRLTKLTAQLLTLARAEGSDTLALLPLDLQDVVAEAVASLAERARDAGVHLAVELDDVPDVLGDPVWLTQFVLNVLDNALRHTPAGRSVRVCLGAADRGGDHGARLRIEDTGEGIPPEHLPHLFERFYRVDASRTRASGGAGIGLAICKWIASAHHGTVTVESTPGVGSAFTLWLPAAHASVEGEAAAAVA